MLLKKTLLLIFTCFCHFSCIFSQEYLIEGRKRLNFAQTYFELGAQYYPAFDAFSSATQAPNGYEQVRNTATTLANLQIGGIHFWGHADFYISIPLAGLGQKRKDPFQLNESVVTGARLMPWTYRHGRITPYIGTAWAIRNYQQAGPDSLQTPLITKNTLRFDAGLVYGRPHFLFRMGVLAQTARTLAYPVNKTHFENIRLPALSPFVALAYTFESTKTKGMDAINQQLNAYPGFSSPNLKNKATSGWFVGIGASTCWVLSVSARNVALYPFLNQRSVSRTYADVAMGYHFSGIGLATALSWRNIVYKQHGYGVEQNLRRNAIVFESYKFLLDYHGFTPYFGVGIGLDHYTFREQNDEHTTDVRKSMFSKCLIFGWDILPGKTRQAWVLRTNLRWFPFETLPINSYEHRLNQLEYNVIQLVWYPGRSNSKQ